MNEPAAADVEHFLQQFVEIFNDAAERRDFARFVGLFADNAVLEFDGLPAPDVRGKPAIAQHYRDDPPDDRMRILRWKTLRTGEIAAEFQWSDIPEARGGCLIVKRCFR